MTSSPAPNAIAEALADAGLSNRQVEQATGKKVNRETLRRRLANESAFRLGEIEHIAPLVGMSAAELVARREARS